MQNSKSRSERDVAAQKGSQVMISVVVPGYNEEAVLKQTYARLQNVLGGLSEIDYEILFIDDGSADRTWEWICGFQERDDHVRGIRLSRNFGHQLAIIAGLENAMGDAVILLDADCQDPPELIPDMIKKWKEGFEVVFGQRVSRDGETWFKRASASVFYRFLNCLSDIEIPRDTGDFRLMDTKVVQALLDMPERDRFTRGMVAWAGFRQVALPYSREARFAGESKYPLLKMMAFAADGILSFSLRPLRLASLLGFLTSAVALMVIVYALVARIFGEPVTGWTALITSVLFIGGVQLICLGIIGEYVGRTYAESKRRPLYLISDRRGFRSVQRDDHE
ncbi:MAG: glycosyltransferase [Alphaproteobacteria bacterium]|nr:glycosyltransferase [Alphaproteobacteria bacterium]